MSWSRVARYSILRTLGNKDNGQVCRLLVLITWSRNWGNTLVFCKTRLVKFLSDHIIHYPQPDTKSSTSPDNLMVSPLVMSSAGLDKKVAEDREMGKYPISESEYPPGTARSCGAGEERLLALPRDDFMPSSHFPGKSFRDHFQA